MVEHFLNVYRPTHFLYDIIHLDDEVVNDDLINIIDTPISQMRIKTFNHSENFS
jgi:hypothetical protein